MVTNSLSSMRQNYLANSPKPTASKTYLPGIPRTPFPYQAAGIKKFSDVIPATTKSPDIIGSVGGIKGPAELGSVDPSAPAPGINMPEFLKQAAGLITGVDYSGVANDYSAIAAKARARIGAMYKALQGERQAAEAVYSGYRDAANQSIGASADKAASDIATAYQNASDQQASEMAALGLADTLAQSAAQNTAEDQGYNASRAVQMGASYKNANELGRASDLAYNQGMIGAAGFAGAEGKAQIDQQLSQLLAQLAMAQQQSNAQLPFQQMQYAQGLQSMWQAQHPQLSIDDQIALQRINSYNTRYENQRRDAQYWKFRDSGMDDAAAKQAVNDYFNNQ